MPHGAPPPDVKAYLAKQSPVNRAALLKLRATILSIVPDATERISYQIPAFERSGRVIIWMAGFEKHCSFFGGTTGALLARASGVPESALSKGTIRFAPDRPLSAALVKQIVKARINEAGPRPAKSAAKKPRRAAQERAAKPKSPKARPRG